MLNEKIVVHIDPAIGSTNLGDEVISEAVARHIKLMFPEARIINIASRDIGKWAKGVLKAADTIIFGGSNALSANPVLGYRQFAMGFMQYLGVRNVTLMGVGWWQYQDSFGPFAQTFYKKVLRHDIIHSVRDEYTLTKLKALGFEGALNTACPTMWSLDSFETGVSENVVVTLTDYNRNFDRDLALLSKSLEKFNRVYFWPQGTRDNQYLQTFSSVIDLQRIELIKPNLQALDDVLHSGACYAGTRLHAGIRALQFKRPSFIIPIDNRAVEIAKMEHLTLVNPALETVEVGAKFNFSHTAKPEIQQFLNQFR
ncbi:MAG: polysaccharide pyruvyl transferase family protein [Methylococcales bacterium]|nr:polysaccharide pyruvyl transferase family protein [Methylococcaceae bacterium]